MKKAKHIEFVIKEATKEEAEEILKEIKERFGKKYYLGCYYSVEIMEDK